MRKLVLMDTPCLQQPGGTSEEESPGETDVYYYPSTGSNLLLVNDDSKQVGRHGARLCWGLRGWGLDPWSARGL